MKPVVPFVSQTTGHERAVWLTALPEALSDIAIVKPISDMTKAERAAARVAIVANPDVAELDLLPNLQWVHSLWAGVERLAADLPQNGPKIVRLEDPQMAETMSEAVLAWTLYLHRDMPRYAAQQHRKLWLEHPLKRPNERTVAVLGLGNLGAAAAKRLAGNGFDVCGWSRSHKEIAGIATFSGGNGLAEVLSKADIVVILLPLTGATRGLVGKEALSQMPEGANLINFARGPIVDTEALTSALDRGHLSHAVLDVFDPEPLPDESPLWDHPKITILPHISAPTITATATKILAANIGRYFETGDIPAHVDRKRGY